MIETTGKNFQLAASKECRVVIGDETALSFKPHVRVTRWGEEGSFGFGLPTLRNVAPTFDGSRIVWSDVTVSGLEMRFYEPGTSPQWERGGLEWEIVLTRKPAGSSIVLSLDMIGLVALYQPPLTPWEIARGNLRPANVVGSYAFYHASRSTLHGEPDAADKYQAGKAFHLYRPEAVDALGRRTWGALAVDAAVGTVTLSFNPAWLAAAVYPVVIDPTVGYTTLGASIDNTNEYTVTNQVTPGTSGDANPGTAYIGCRQLSGSLTGQLGAYAGGGTNPNGKSRLAASSNITPTSTMGFRSAAITWTGITASTNYWMGVFMNNGHGTAYDSGLTGHYHGLDPGGIASDPWGTEEGTADMKISMYVDYAAAGGLAIPVVLKQYRQRWGG